MFSWCVFVCVCMQGKTLGRLACLVAGHLRGANLPTYSPSVDMGGYVVVINAEKVVVSGSKATQKLYRRHTTGRPGSMKVRLPRRTRLSVVIAGWLRGIRRIRQSDQLLMPVSLAETHQGFMLELQSSSAHPRARVSLCCTPGSGRDVQLPHSNSEALSAGGLALHRWRRSRRCRRASRSASSRRR